jgi:hypothetical protein
MKPLFIPFLILALLFVSCEREDSADVNQDRIYTIYSLVYEADQDITYARAWFRFGSAVGTLLELSEPSNVSFNDQRLSFQNAFAYYEKSLPGKTMSGSFFWEDYDGLQFNNAVSMKEIDFPSDLTEISQDQSFELFWEGMPLKNDEYVAVAINGNFEGDASIIWERGNGSQSIAIPKSQLEKLPVDQPATFWLEFGYNPPLAQATGAGGEIYGKYRVSKTIMIR